MFGKPKPKLKTGIPRKPAPKPKPKCPPHSWTNTRYYIGFFGGRRKKETCSKCGALRDVVA